MVEERILNTKNLICFWDFQEESGQNRQAKGPNSYKLIEGNDPVERVKDGLFGPYASKLSFGQWFHIPRKDCQALNIYGKDAQVTIIAWVKREKKENPECQAIAGMWNETNKQRQYCLFLNLGIWNSSEQVGGHVSAIGGPTKGYKYCMDASIGSTPVPYGEWQCIAFTYDGKVVKSYLNGILDERPDLNPFDYEYGLFDGEEDGADFTVGSVYRAGEMGNFYTGLIGGLAVFDRALTSEELQCLSKLV